MQNKKLLIRDEFREGVFERDNHRCVVPDCHKKAVDAHHLIERRLWSDGGYYLDNGASVCEEHHKLAEINKLLPVTLRVYAGICGKVYPENMDTEEEYTKWGKHLPVRLTPNLKYPSTYYLPFSYIPPEHTKDLGIVKHLLKCPLVITTKMDGSNLKNNPEKVAARNGWAADHKSFDYAKVFHAQFRHKIPGNLDVFGEWLYAKHSIHYTGELKLSNFLQLFATYDHNTNMWAGWKEVEDMARNLGVTTVPIIKTARYEKEYELIADLTRIAKEVIAKGHEGIVVRNMFPIHPSKFTENVMKFVREDHVQTNKHWSGQTIIKNVCQGIKAIVGK